MQSTADGDRRPFVFTGTGGAYFRIWIVNLLLTIVTLGIYSPWAKVRRLRYLYGSTTFDGSPFEFHGRPIALLKGRLIGLVLLVAYTQAAKVSIWLWIAVAVALLLLMPWLLWKSLRFRLANTSYRGIRFGFDGTIGRAYLAYVPLIVLVIGPAFVTLAMQRALLTPGALSASLFARAGTAFAAATLLTPWFYFRLRAYQHRHARLGVTPFSFDGRVRSAYWIAIKLLLAAIGVSLVVGLVVGGLVFFMHRANGVPMRGASAPDLLPIALAYFVLLSAVALPIASIQNYVWDHSLLGDERFASRVAPGRLWAIVASNLLLTFVTLGFFWPFAVVRATRYRIQAMRWGGDSTALTAGATTPGIAATGEETADLFGLDLAL